jgi:hypothetical protein
MRLSFETVAIFAFVLAIVALGLVGIESIFDSYETHGAPTSDKKCKGDVIDESICVLHLPDLDFNY